MKTFILPYFDYFLSLAIYYSHSLIRRVAYIYHHCLSQLFNLTFSNNSKFNLFSFNHRVLYRLFIFFYKIYSINIIQNLFFQQILLKFESLLLRASVYDLKKNISINFNTYLSSFLISFNKFYICIKFD